MNKINNDFLKIEKIVLKSIYIRKKNNKLFFILIPMPKHVEKNR